MIIKRLIVITVLITTIVNLIAQDKDDLDGILCRSSFYDLELIPNGTIQNGDTIYRVVLVMDIAEIERYIDISIESPQNISTRSTSSLFLKPTTELLENRSQVRFELMEWSDISTSNIIATRKDGKKVLLRPRPDPEAISQRERTLRAQTRDVHIIEEGQLPEEEMR